MPYSGMESDKTDNCSAIGHPVVRCFESPDARFSDGIVARPVIPRSGPLPALSTPADLVLRAFRYVSGNLNLSVAFPQLDILVVRLVTEQCLGDRGRGVIPLAGDDFDRNDVVVTKEIAAVAIHGTPFLRRESAQSLVLTTKDAAKAGCNPPHPPESVRGTKKQRCEKSSFPPVQ